MQKREKLRQKGCRRSKKTKCHGRGKISFSEGGGIYIIFGPKNRPVIRS
jgi:hypothetical protein